MKRLTKASKSRHTPKASRTLSERRGTYSKRADSSSGGLHLYDDLHSVTNTQMKLLLDRVAKLRSVASLLGKLEASLNRLKAQVC